MGRSWVPIVRPPCFLRCVASTLGCDDDDDDEELATLCVIIAPHCQQRTRSVVAGGGAGDGVGNSRRTVQCVHVDWMCGVMAREGSTPYVVDMEV